MIQSIFNIRPRHSRGFGSMTEAWIYDLYQVSTVAIANNLPICYRKKKKKNRNKVTSVLL